MTSSLMHTLAQHENLDKHALLLKKLFFLCVSDGPRLQYLLQKEYILMVESRFPIESMYVMK
jgi:hypothetical protein